MPLLRPKVRSDLEFFDQEIDGDTIVVVRDPIRGTYFKYNVLQAGMLRALDGVRTLDEILAALSAEYEVEIPRATAERFMARARTNMLLDITSYGLPEGHVHKVVMKALEKRGFRFRDARGGLDAGLTKRQVSAESVLFIGGIRQLQAGKPAKALDYFSAVLELNPDNERARLLATTIQAAYVKALSASSTDFPTIWTFNPTRALLFLDRTVGRFAFRPWALIPFFAIIAAAFYAFSITKYPALNLGVGDIALALVLEATHAFIHEFGHALACYHYGGSVTEIGWTAFYYIRLLPYCDTSSSYLFTDRRYQVAVQLAGSIVSLVFVSLLFILLALIKPSFILYQGTYVIMWLGLFTVFLNFIPFIKFDGYFALCDYLAIPNLRERSIRVLKSWCGARLFGLPQDDEPLTPRRHRFFLVFAALSVVFTGLWIYQALFRLLAPIVERYHGPGLVVSALILLKLLNSALFKPLGRLLGSIWRERRRVFTLRRGAALLLVGAVLVLPWTIRWPVMVDADFVIAPKQRIEVRAQTSGRVDEIRVREGQLVKRGDVLAQLRNDGLEHDIAVAEADLAAASAKLAELQSGARHEAVALVSRQLDVAQAVLAKSAERATLASRLARGGMGPSADAANAAGIAQVNQSLASAARFNLATLQAGSRQEDITAAEAARARVVAQLDHLRVQRDLLAIKSPIDGVVATKHLGDLQYMWLAPGDTLLELYDPSGFVAEIHLTSSAPLDEVGPGDVIALKPTGAPGHEIATMIDHLRKTETDTVVVSAPFDADVGRVNMDGAARIYGTEHSFAYAKLYLPLARVFRVKLWSLM